MDIGFHGRCCTVFDHMPAVGSGVKLQLRVATIHISLATRQDKDGVDRPKEDGGGFVVKGTDKAPIWQYL